MAAPDASKTYDWDATCAEEREADKGKDVEGARAAWAFLPCEYDRFCKAVLLNCGCGPAVLVQEVKRLSAGWLAKGHARVVSSVLSYLLGCFDRGILTLPEYAKRARQVSYKAILRTTKNSPV